jgi:hypothetical protein
VGVENQAISVDPKGLASLLIEMLLHKLQTREISQNRRPVPQLGSQVWGYQVKNLVTHELV